jgi:hypothetical protein
VQHTVQPHRPNQPGRGRTPAAVAEDQQLGTVGRVAQDIPGMTRHSLHSDGHVASALAVRCNKLVDPALGGLEDIVDELVGLGSSSIVSEARP